VDDTSDQAVSTYGYIYINAAGKIEMDDVEADEADTSGNTSGILRYNDTGTDTTDRRMIGWFFMNATGSGELNSYEVGNLKDGDVVNSVYHTDTTNDVINDTSYGTDVTAMTVRFYSSGRGKTNILGNVRFSAADAVSRQIHIEVHDGADIEASEGGLVNHLTNITDNIICMHSETYAQGGITFDLKGKIDVGTVTIAHKTIIITEN